METTRRTSETRCRYIPRNSGSRRSGRHRILEPAHQAGTAVHRGEQHGRFRPRPVVPEVAGARHRTGVLRRLGRVSSFPRLRIAVARQRTRVAWWHLLSAIRSHRIRAKSPRTNGTLDGSTPAFDLRGYNPIGWQRDVGGEAAALGPIERLPPDVEARRGTLSRYTAQAAPNPSFTGTLLTKMDDDVYEVDHLWDLVLAREYSGVQLVGKRLEFVYLAASDRTLRWFNGGGERYQTSALAGGTLLIARDGLDRCGGWRKVQGRGRYGTGRRCPAGAFTAPTPLGS